MRHLSSKSQTESGTGVAKGQGWVESGESLLNGDKVSVLQDEKSFGDDGGDSYKI